MTNVMNIDKWRNEAEYFRCLLLSLLGGWNFAAHTSSSSSSSSSTTLFLTSSSKKGYISRRIVEPRKRALTGWNNKPKLLCTSAHFLWFLRRDSVARFSNQSRLPGMKIIMSLIVAGEMILLSSFNSPKRVGLGEKGLKSFHSSGIHSKFRFFSEN